MTRILGSRVDDILNDKVELGSFEETRAKARVLLDELRRCPAHPSRGVRSRRSGSSRSECCQRCRHRSVIGGQDRSRSRNDEAERRLANGSGVDLMDGFTD